jgi:prevent-host-death family protein
MLRMTTSQARLNFKSTVQKAAKGQRILLSSHGNAVAAIVPLEDLALLQAIEDRIDAKAARAAQAEARREGTIPWERIKADLNLEQGA